MLLISMHVVMMVGGYVSSVWLVCVCGWVPCIINQKERHHQVNRAKQQQEEDLSLQVTILCVGTQTHTRRRGPQSEKEVGRKNKNGNPPPNYCAYGPSPPPLFLPISDVFFNCAFVKSLVFICFVFLSFFLPSLYLFASFIPLYHMHTHTQILEKILFYLWWFALCFLFY